MEPAGKPQTYKVIVCSEDENLRNFLKKFMQKRGYDVATFPAPEHCPNFSSSEPCLCTAEKRCADIVILGRHLSGVKTFDLLDRQNKGKCKLTIKNKLVIASTFDEADDKHAKELGANIMYMPFSISDLNDWLDGCEERLKTMD